MDIEQSDEINMISNRTYHYCFFPFYGKLSHLKFEEHNHRLQLKDKHLIVRPKQESGLNSATKILLLDKYTVVLQLLGTSC